MSLGRAPIQENMFESTRTYCESQLEEGSIYRWLSRESHRLFADETFEDLFEEVGRRSIPPRIVATVMVLQRFEGLSDREAVDRFRYDLRWKYAAGGLDYNYPSFTHTVLVDMRERLRGSSAPNRIFDAVVEAAKGAGLLGRKRVIDSTVLYDAVATQDTVTMIRSAIRGLLRVASVQLKKEIRAVLKRDDNYDTAGKPVCDWADPEAREQLINALARDAHAVLALLDNRDFSIPVLEALVLLATVVGQDVEQGEDGIFRIVRKVAPDRVISTVDPEARHGHKTSARGFDGYKGHVAVDPDSEIVTATEVTVGNAGDAVAAPALIEEALSSGSDSESPVEIYGDAAYGTAELVQTIENASAEANVKVQPPSSKKGMFSQEAFQVDEQNRTVTCPAGKLVQLRRDKDGAGIATFAGFCSHCPLQPKCTTSKSSRTIRTHPQHATLLRARTRQRQSQWREKYRATRPKVERKMAHMMRRRHGGRRVRMRGIERIRHDFSLLAAATNIHRLAMLRVHFVNHTWTAQQNG